MLPIPASSKSQKWLPCTSSPSPSSSSILSRTPLGGGFSPGTKGLGHGHSTSGDWASMSPTAGSLLDQINNGPPPSGNSLGGLETMFSRLSYSAAASREPHLFPSRMRARILTLINRQRRAARHGDTQPQWARPTSSRFPQSTERTCPYRRRRRSLSDGVRDTTLTSIRVSRDRVKYCTSLAFV